MFPNDVDLAFIAGNTLDDADGTDGELAKRGAFVGEAIEAFVLGIEAAGSCRLRGRRYMYPGRRSVSRPQGDTAVGIEAPSRIKFRMVLGLVASMFFKSWCITGPSPELGRN